MNCAENFALANCHTKLPVRCRMRENIVYLQCLAGHCGGPILAPGRPRCRGGKYETRAPIGAKIIPTMLEQAAQHRHGRKVL